MLFEVAHWELQPYDAKKAEGQELLRTLENGVLRRHVYSLHWSVCLICLHSFLPLLGI